MVPLLIAPTGGPIGDALVAQRTFATVPFGGADAVLLASGAPAGPGTHEAVSPDPRIQVLLQEAWRHCKAIGAWGPGVSVVEQAIGSAATDAAGVVTGQSGAEVFEQVHTLLGAHRAWERF